MYKVQYKCSNANQAWNTAGSYGSESDALASAARAAEKYFMVRVLDQDGNLVWSA